jgi:hypothetical protein
MMLPLLRVKASLKSMFHNNVSQYVTHLQALTTVQALPLIEVRLPLLMLLLLLLLLLLLPLVAQTTPSH